MSPAHILAQLINELVGQVAEKSANLNELWLEKPAKRGRFKVIFS